MQNWLQPFSKKFHMAAAIQKRSFLRFNFEINLLAFSEFTQKQGSCNILTNLKVAKILLTSYLFWIMTELLLLELLHKSNKKECANQIIWEIQQSFKNGNSKGYRTFMNF